METMEKVFELKAKLKELKAELEVLCPSVEGFPFFCGYCGETQFSRLEVGQTEFACTDCGEEHERCL